MAITVKSTRKIDYSSPTLYGAPRITGDVKSVTRKPSGQTVTFQKTDGTLTAVVTTPTKTEPQKTRFDYIGRSPLAQRVTEQIPRFTSPLRGDTRERIVLREPVRVTPTIRTITQTQDYRPTFKGITATTIESERVPIQETRSVEGKIPEKFKVGQRYVPIYSKQDERKQVKNIIKDIKQKNKESITQYKELEGIGKGTKLLPLIKDVALKNTIDTLYELNNELSKKNMFKADTDSKALNRIIAGSIVSIPIGYAKGVLGATRTILSPTRYFKNIQEAVKNPKETLKLAVTEFTKNPAGFVAEFKGYSSTLGYAGKKLKQSPVGRYVAQELYILQQPKKLQPYVRAILKSSKAQAKIGKPIKNIKSVDLFEVKNLNRAEAIALKKTLQTSKTDPVVFGSVASRTLTKKKTPVPKDVDIASSNVKQFSQDFINNLPKNLRAQYMIKGEKLIRKSDGVALFDIKPLERLIPQRSFILKRGELPVAGLKSKVVLDKSTYLPKLKKKLVDNYISVPTQKIQTVQGIKLVGLGEQTTRKGLGTLQVLLEKNIKRAKDPQSFILSLEIQLKLLKESSKTPFTKSKINTITDALKVLKSKEFVKILEDKTGGLSNEFPIFNQVNTKKLKDFLKERKDINIKDLDVKNNKIINTKTGEVLGDFSQLPLSKTSVSRLPPSKLPSSKLPSKLPVSRLPSSLPSVTPVSKLPSKLPISKLPSSKLPSKLPVSRLPSRLPVSKVPSVIPPSKLPISKLPKSRLPESKIPVSKIPTSKIPSSKIPKLELTPIKPANLTKRLREELKDELEKLKKKGITNIRYQYTPTIAGSGLKAQRTTGKFGGFEIRGSIIKLKPVKVKKYKRKNLKNTAFVIKHRRRKPRK